MRDRLDREIDYMRISVTDRCNLRCVYCMPEKGVPSLDHADILRFSEIAAICRAAAGLGISRIKLTGGEPLVRRGIVSLVEEIASVEGIEEITMTTNGVLLEELYDALVDAGLKAVTVSLDTMDPERYGQITRRDELARVRAGLQYAAEKNRIPLKVNCVPLTDSRPEDLAEVAFLAKDAPIHVRFIEMMPIGLGQRFGCVPEEQLIGMLQPFTGKLTRWEGRLGNGPAHYYEAEGFLGKLGFISAVSHRFCGGCNRIRLTSDGFLKSCLQYSTGVDLRPALSDGRPEVLREAIAEAVRRKPAGHSFGRETDGSGTEKKNMSQIGG